MSNNTNELNARELGRFGLEVVWSKYSKVQRVSSLHLSKGTYKDFLTNLENTLVFIDLLDMLDSYILWSPLVLSRNLCNSF